MYLLESDLQERHEKGGIGIYSSSAERSSKGYMWYMCDFLDLHMYACNLLKLRGYVLCYYYYYAIIIIMLLLLLLCTVLLSPECSCSD